MKFSEAHHSGCCWGKKGERGTQRSHNTGDADVPAQPEQREASLSRLLIYGSKKCHIRSKDQAPEQRSQIFSVKIQTENILRIAGRIMSSLSFLFLLPPFLLLFLNILHLSFGNAKLFLACGPCKKHPQARLSP